MKVHLPMNPTPYISTYPWKPSYQSSLNHGSLPIYIHLHGYHAIITESTYLGISPHPYPLIKLLVPYTIKVHLLMDPAPSIYLLSNQSALNYGSCPIYPLTYGYLPIKVHLPMNLTPSISPYLWIPSYQSPLTYESHPIYISLPMDIFLSKFTYLWIPRAAPLHYLRLTWLTWVLGCFAEPPGAPGGKREK